MLSKKLYSVLSVISLSGVLLASSSALSAEQAPLPAWSYQGKTGPAQWAGLSDAYGTCEEGYMQSPIDIRTSVKALLPPLKTDYRPEQATVVNNGHTVQVNLAGDSALTLNGDAYTLRQFHFHVPSENRINGQTFPGEMHLVHQSENDSLAVIAVMIEEGDTNEALASVIRDAPAGPSEGGVVLARAFDASRLLPQDQHYFAFDGSLTTPPCSEGVSWRVLKQPVSLSEEQIRQLEDIMPRHNARPLQSVGGRIVVEGTNGPRS